MKCQAHNYDLTACATVLTAFNRARVEPLCDRCAAHRSLMTAARVVAIEERACPPWAKPENFECDNCLAPTLHQVSHGTAGTSAVCTTCGHAWYTPTSYPKTIDPQNQP